MSSSFLPRLSRRLSLAPTQAKDAGFGMEDESASLLMDMSLTELKKKSPVKSKKGNRKQITEDDLDKLSQEELELLAWEAVEEENRLQGRRKSRRISNSTEEPMKNVTVRQKSNTPRKGSKEDHKQGEAHVENEAPPTSRQTDCFAPLPRSTSTSAVRHIYDRQASPSRSALRRPHVRKSVAFGEVAEYEISTGEVEVAQSSSDVLEEFKATSSSSNQTATSEVQSSSPLSRFNSAHAPVLPVAKVVFKASKAPLRRTSIRVKEARKSDAGGSPRAPEATKKTTSKLSPKPPVAKTRLREAIKASSAKSRLKARESAVKAKAKAKAEVEVPNGFRLSSTGTLVAKTKCTPFSVAVVIPRVRKSITAVAAPSASKANPVPAWLKRRKDTLLKEEDERLQKEIDRVRSQELAIGQVEEKESEKKSRKPAAPQPAYESAVEKRIAERATWEAKRKANEGILLQEKEKARQQREEREEQEYRLARQRTIPRANPVPDYIRARAAK